LDYMVDYCPRDTLLRAASGDWNIKIDYMVNYRPRDTLPEGRGW
jgi:hypothetical protein